MTQEDKEILIRDLCGRLSYGVKAYIKNWSKLDRKYYEGVYTVESIDPLLNNIFADSERGSVEVIVGHDDYKIKPYLFPLSSMTEEQKKEYNLLQNFVPIYYYGFDIMVDKELYDTWESIDYLNAHHFDYRGLIDKDLAIDATGFNIY